jgi:hypothetical protein
MRTTNYHVLKIDTTQFYLKGNSGLLGNLLTI